MQCLSLIACGGSLLVDQQRACGCCAVQTFCLREQHTVFGAIGKGGTGKWKWKMEMENGNGNGNGKGRRKWKGSSVRFYFQRYEVVQTITWHLSWYELTGKTKWKFDSSIGNWVRGHGRSIQTNKIAHDLWASHRSSPVLTPHLLSRIYTSQLMTYAMSPWLSVGCPTWK